MIKPLTFGQSANKLHGTSAMVSSEASKEANGPPGYPRLARR